MQTSSSVLSTEQLQTLGSRLAELRRGKGVTAVEVATTVLGYSNGSHVAVTRLERGVLVRPRLDHLKSLAGYYGVEPEHLFIPVLTGHSEAPEAVTPPAPKPQAARARKEPADLPSRVRWVREGASLTPFDFAKALCSFGAVITTGNVEAWEGGEREPNPIQLRALSRFAGRPEGWFSRGAEGEVPLPEPRAWLGQATA